jgi:hypothetical protein
LKRIIDEARGLVDRGVEASRRRGCRRGVLDAGHTSRLVDDDLARIECSIPFDFL